MERKIVGSSNVCRNYAAKNFTSFCEYKVMKTVDINSFKAYMGGNGKADKIIVSVIENFIIDAGSKLESHDYEEEESDKKLNNCIKATVDQYIAIIDEAAEKNPNSRFAIVRPIMRPSCDWYQVKLPIIRKFIDDGIKVAKRSNVSRVDAIPMASQQFEIDGVHLTKTSGRVFMQGILSGSEQFFVDNPIETEENVNANASGESNQQKSRQDCDKASEAIRRITLVEQEMKARRTNDNLLFARIREELDSITNRAKEDRIIVTGLTSATPPPTGPGPRKEWLHQIVNNIVTEIDPDFKGKILFINQGRNSGRDIPMVEIRMDSKESAAGIRKAYADKRKAGKDFGRLFMANCVGLATRVRVDVMKAIALKLSNTDQASYVTAFTSRPILHVKPKSDQKPMAYTFADAAEKFGHLVREADLGEAYRRAGNSFNGQLEQHFIVVKDGQGQGNEWNAKLDESRKRKMDEGTSSAGYSKSKKQYWKK